ncbi:hypothetical protein KQR57_04090 [Bacillus inaquosorum]|nr:hypothetical protein [Bacillus inaquosorum]
MLFLARLKNPRFLEEVQQINGADHNFLLGFYYRLTGNDIKAIERLNKALEERPNFARAKRELVVAYNNIEEYQKPIISPKRIMNKIRIILIIFMDISLVYLTIITMKTFY